jgi:hypothetical protein
MTHPPVFAFSRRAHRLLVTSLVSLPLFGACSDDEGAPAPPVDLTLSITALDGSAPADAGDLRCDGTLAVQVGIEPARSFTLRPRSACGESTRCGYVHVEAFDVNGTLVASVDSVTTLGLLELPTGPVPQLGRIDAVLLRGIDAEPVLNADGTEVATSVDVTLAAPADCPPLGGEGGAPAAGGAPSAGGAPTQPGGAGPGGAPGSAGAGGSPAGGAAGSDAGGAGNPDPNAGAGGA